MISIIIASGNDRLLANVKQNIAATIGIEHEIIAFKNHKGKYGLCELYNKGTQLAKHNLVCFMHEDILFETYNWGGKVIHIFNTIDEIGLLGIAGSIYKTLSPSSWAPPMGQMESTWRINIKQCFKRQDIAEKHDYINPYNESISQVACIDGVWMCSKKEIIAEIGFDQKLLKGFHGYDIDISMAINQKHKVFVTYEILLKHFSEGDYNRDWLKEIIKVHRKWSPRLPLRINWLTSKNIVLLQQEKEHLKHFLLQLLPQEHLPLGLKLKYISSLFFLKKIDFRIYRKSLKKTLGLSLRKTRKDT